MEDRSNFIKNADGDFVNMQYAQRIYIQRISADEYEPTRKWRYCVDVSFAYRGASTLKVFESEEEAEKWIDQIIQIKPYI